MIKAALTIALTLSANAAFADDDMGQIATRLGQEIEVITNDMVDGLREMEKTSGPIALPGGTEITVDDILNGNALGLGANAMRGYGNMMVEGAKSTVNTITNKSAIEIPKLPVTDRCLKQSHGALEPVVAYTDCVGAEQTAYNGIKPNWGAYSEDLRSACVAVSRARGKSYIVLAECLGPVTEGESLSGDFKY